VTAPNHTMTNTAAKTRDAEFPGAVQLSMDESNRQTMSGPHKSPMIRKEGTFSEFLASFFSHFRH
jgi:hypothetical protein